MKQPRHVFTSEVVTTKENVNKPNDALNEVGELKARMKLLINKLQVSKKEKEQVVRENQILQQEIIQMQTDLRCMVTGFANTSSNFPMTNELLNQFAEFGKCECFDIFFDVLCPDLNLKGIIFFYKTSIEKVQKVINAYFQPAFGAIKHVGQFESLDGPIMNVLRKSFQTSYKSIEQKISLNIVSIKEEIQKHLKLEDNQNLIQLYLGRLINLLNQQDKLLTLLLSSYISDPPIHLDIQSVGTSILFNQAKHDPIDGFIKNKEECIILIPQIFKNEEQVGKALVISSSYEFN